MSRAICVATGSSLTKADVELCKGAGKVYAVNDAHRLAPWAEVLYACDAAWWQKYNAVPEFKGEKWTVNYFAAREYKLNHIVGVESEIFSMTPGRIATGFNSGFQAMNLAALQGATQIILLGYDMQLSAGGARHWFGEHPTSLRKNSDYSKWVKHFEKAAPMIEALGIEVINCTRDTALHCFPHQPLEVTL